MSGIIRTADVNIQVSDEARVQCELDTTTHPDCVSMSVKIIAPSDFKRGSVCFFPLRTEQARGLRDSMAVAVQQLTAWLGDEEETG